MDHGATICTPANPRCEVCPVAAGCIARRDGLIALLPVREKKTAVKNRYFHYVLLQQAGRIWIRRREEKDIWRGLYEPLLIESDTALDRKSIRGAPGMARLDEGQPLEYEGALTQRLTHQLIHLRFFSAFAAGDAALPDGGIWVLPSQLADFAFPRSVNTFFQKKNYF